MVKEGIIVSTFEWKRDCAVMLELAEYNIINICALKQLWSAAMRPVACGRTVIGCAVNKIGFSAVSILVKCLKNPFFAVLFPINLLFI